MNILEKTYIIYFRDGRYKVADESFSHYLDKTEIVERGIKEFSTADLWAARMNTLKAFKMDVIDYKY